MENKSREKRNFNSKCLHCNYLDHNNHLQLKQNFKFQGLKQLIQTTTRITGKRYMAYSQKRLFWHYRFQLSFIYKSVCQISFNLFWSGERRLLSKFLRKWGWFRGHNERFPKYLGWKLKFQKTETTFCR